MECPGIMKCGTNSGGILFQHPLNNYDIYDLDKLIHFFLIVLLTKKVIHCTLFLNYVVLGFATNNILIGRYLSSS